MQETSAFINRIEESETLAAARIARELKQQGKDVIALNLGEPDFPAPDFVKQAAIKAVEDDYSKYPPVNGLLELREAICNKFKRDNALEFTPNQIVVSTGAKQSLVNVVLSLVNPEDEVVVFTPYWVSYKAMVDLSGATFVPVSAGVEQDFKVTPNQLKAALSEKTRLLMFSSPCNPTGSVYSQEELEAIAEVLKDYPRVVVVSDEIYEHINFTAAHYSIGRCEALKDRVVTVNGVSKSFAMTGYRIGYIGAPQWIANACNKLQGQFTSGANAVAQMAAKAAVEANPEQVYFMRDDFKKRRDLVKAGLEKIPGFTVNQPTGAFYIFPDVSGLLGKTTPDGKTLHNAGDFCEYILQDTYVSLVTGAAFGAPNCIRISYATATPLLKEALQRIAAAVEKLG